MADKEIESQVTGGRADADLIQAQRERPAEQVGAPYGHGAVRRVTADELDPHRDWTVQSGRPFPQDDDDRTTRFHPAELPDPQKAVDAGLLPQVLPVTLIDSAHVTQPPSANPALDDPLREANRDNDPGYAASKATSVSTNLEAAQGLRELDGSPEDRGGNAADNAAADNASPAKAEDTSPSAGSPASGTTSFTPGGSESS